jgi:hypothetical protein
MCSSFFFFFFFYDILVYKTTMQQHLQDLEAVLQLLRSNSLVAKRSKCSFAGGRLNI